MSSMGMVAEDGPIREEMLWYDRMSERAQNWLA